MGYYLTQIGLYFSTKENTNFEECLLHDNIKSYLLQAYLYLADYNKERNLVTQQVIYQNNNDDEKYLTKKEVIKLYYPLFTEYGLSQALHTQNLPYHKRGNKYFFRKSEIDSWINDNKSNKSVNTRRQSYKLV